ncbi:polyamine ABC transporter substrate-binding protein [Kiloniella laminariae]|uniref:Putrescine-binding periplasmic protein n=2 Tax=Kiloniella laminariae TaxID=454162 RepID=A0ABT4LR40_9PROT|nr:polyamine ABC transporter substrate-binding protein [Kiloniella laminariae]MCZ4282796.1 polyamine ABC transporter substrate-binding protein [Kiloniella laminariae]
MKTLGNGLFTSMIALGLTLGAQAQAEEVVKVYNWSDYIDEEILTEFEAETGIKVIYDVFDSNDVLETKLLAGSSGYDIVVPSGTFLGRQVQAGVFQKLDKSKLSNIGNVWDVVAERVVKYDPENAYSINYMWGTTGIGYNVDMIKERLGLERIDSWDVVYQPENIAKLADCGVFMLDASDEMIPAALNYLGKDPDSRDKADFEAAEALLMTIRPYVRKFHSSEYISALANGDICLAVGWSGDILQARDRAAEADNGVVVDYAIPKQGALMWFDQMAIPADAENADNAHKFLDYILRDDVMAKASNYVYYANGNLPSQKLLNEDVIGDPAIYPDSDTMQKLYTLTPYDPKSQKLVTRSWTRVKSGS